MKKLYFLFLCIGLFAFGQSKEKAKLSTSGMHELYVTFDAGDFDSDNAIVEIMERFPKVASVLTNHNATVSKGFDFTEEKLDEMEVAAIKFSGNAKSVKTLRNTFKIHIPNSDNQSLLEIARELESIDGIESCDLFSLENVPPPGDILPVTPNFESQQTYLNANPGVNMKYAWNMNLAGNGIRIRDVEYGFNKQHEEFNDRDNVQIAPGMNIGSTVPSDWVDHGTAVFGIVFGDKGSYGVSGMAYDATEMLMFPQVQESGSNTINAITQAVSSSATGDVILFEMQQFGQNNNYVPAEYNLTIWNLTKAATDAGITVVSAAANGNENLDDPFYINYLNRGDSGAIIVGAGTSNLSHNKMSYSTYGSRVDVHAWGQNVYATGYGTSALIGDDFNQSYCYFSGTSSATPIVASCAAVLQSYYHSLTGNYLTSVELRDILVITGIPQGSGGHIGPIPNMQAAINQINLLNVADVDDFAFAVYPNPATSAITFYGQNFSANANVEIVNSIGQTISQMVLPADATVDVSNLSSGFYFLSLTDNGRTSVRKIVKN